MCTEKESKNEKIRTTKKKRRKGGKGRHQTTKPIFRFIFIFYKISLFECTTEQEAEIYFWQINFLSLSHFSYSFESSEIAGFLKYFAFFFIYFNLFQVHRMIETKNGAISYFVLKSSTL